MKSFLQNFKNLYTYKVLGLMSGTSEDGIDLCFAHYTIINGKWDFNILKTETIPFSDEEINLLHNAFKSEVQEIEPFDLNFGEIIGNKLNAFISSLSEKPDFVCSHGHTIFHQPQSGITVQIGNGQVIADLIKLPVVNNFRNLDVKLGGQGAPLVPIGDKLLFSQYTACLNIGGFSNISFENKERLAFDISPANLPLNKFMLNFFNLPYDNKGEIAASGKPHQPLLKQLNEIQYYRQTPPKSLGAEWLNKQFIPLVNNHLKSISKKDIICTITEHIAIQIANTLNQINAQNCLLSGGGTKNTFLISRIEEHTKTTLITPKPELIDFKEALIFGLLGVLTVRGENNTLKSVTGAARDSCGGELYFPS